MIPVKVVKSEKYSINVVSSEQKSFISSRDKEMDARAVKAVEVALEKARFCKKPVAGYDVATRKAFVEYANGEKKYVD